MFGLSENIETGAKSRSAYGGLRRAPMLIATGGAVDEQRVAVGRGLGDVLVGDVGAGAGLVLDHHLLAESSHILRRAAAR